MRVVHIIDHLRIGGAQRVLLDIVLNLRRSDFEISVVNLRGETALTEKLRSSGCVVETLGLSKFSLSSMASLRSVISRLRPAIVHTHLDFSNGFAARAAWSEGVPVVIRHDHSGSWARNRRYLAKRFLVEKFVGPFTHVIAVSDSVREFNVSLGVDPRKISVIFNGIDLSRFKPPGTADIKKNDRPTVGFVGRICRHKGLENLLAAAPFILRQLPSTNFIIIGDGPDSDRVKNHVARQGLGDAFQFLGYRPQPENFYPGFDVVALPSNVEAFPLCALEAMAMERPVVASRVGGLAEMISDGVNGFLVTRGDNRLLADQVCRLLKDKSLALKIGGEARRTVESRFSLQASVRQINDLYLRLVNDAGEQGTANEAGA